jgi:acyl-CoA thioester hydrolase
MASFRTTRRVEFHQTDAAGIMHFAAFFPVLESVEHEFLRTLGMSVLSHDATGTVSWPRVSAHCDYRGSVTFDDVLDISLEIARLGEKSVTYRFAIDHNNKRVTDAQVVAVYCRVLSDNKLESIAIPAALRSKLQPYVAADK